MVCDACALATRVALGISLHSAGEFGLVIARHAVQISIPEALELLLDAVLNPKLQQWEVEKVAKRLEADLEAFKQDPHACLLEVRHQSVRQSLRRQLRTAQRIPARTACVPKRLLASDSRAAMMCFVVDEKSARFAYVGQHSACTASQTARPAS